MFNDLRLSHIMKVVLLITVLNLGTPISATNDLGTVEILNISSGEYTDSLFGRNPVITIGDNIVSEIWTDVAAYDNPSFGSNGEVKAVYGSTDIYFLFTFDSNLDWIAVQFDSDNTGENAIPMQEDDDMWVMGNTEHVSTNGDGYSAGQGISPFIYNDMQNDVSYELIQNENYNQIELKRSLDTSDSLGNDIIFELETDILVMYASNRYHKAENQIVQHNYYLLNESLFDYSPSTSEEISTANLGVFFVKYLNINLMIFLLITLILTSPKILLKWRKTQ